MDPTTAGLIAISTVVLGITGKILFELRKNVKVCWGIQFRSPEATPQPSPHHSINEHELVKQNSNIEMTTIVPIVPVLPVHNENY